MPSFTPATLSLPTKVPTTHVKLMNSRDEAMPLPVNRSTKKSIFFNNDSATYVAKETVGLVTKIRFLNVSKLLKKFPIKGFP